MEEVGDTERKAENHGQDPKPMVEGGLSATGFGVGLFTGEVRRRGQSALLRPPFSGPVLIEYTLAGISGPAGPLWMSVPQRRPGADRADQEGELSLEVE